MIRQVQKFYFILHVSFSGSPQYPAPFLDGR